jgi:hypothetical protein
MHDMHAYTHAYTYSNTNLTLNQPDWIPPPPAYHFFCLCASGALGSPALPPNRALPLSFLCGACCHCPLRSCPRPSTLYPPPAVRRLTRANTCMSDSLITAHLPLMVSPHRQPRSSPRCPRSSAAHSTEGATRSYSAFGPTTGLGLFFTAFRPSAAACGSMQSSTPPPFAWVTNPSRTPPTSAWESAHSRPLAPHGRATLRRTDLHRGLQCEDSN